MKGKLKTITGGRAARKAPDSDNDDELIIPSRGQINNKTNKLLQFNS
jgi:hypothetical protein